ncbi:FxLYD domain-containing protein [Kitasatospora sp. NPDC085464]|uniref:FxLYD domain-containing protein n=1 Tax=Kitasatospora sp. NPDC085464 TaxID=3364063 RepID=UPI0037CBA7C0
MDRQSHTRVTAPGAGAAARGARVTAPGAGAAATGARVTAQDLDVSPLRRRRPAVAGVLTAALVGAAALAGCSSGQSASSVASQAVSAAEKGASAAASAASALASAAGGAGSALASVASGAGSALASAEARASEAVSAASSAVSGVKGGLDAKGDVTVGAVTTGTDNRTQVQLTVTNHGQQSYKYVIQVNFTDESGKVVDATAVTVPELAAGQSVQAAARSNRELSGTVKADVANAIRY